jgi:glycosyltransferase involved in cell wall biosynthesis
MLTILNVAFPFAPVGPDAVGGAEQVLSAIDAALVRAGHRSLVLAGEGSQAAGELIPVALPSGDLGYEHWVAVHDVYRAALANVLATRRIDVVHFHGVDFHAYVPKSGPPALATLHLSPECYPALVFAPRPGLHLHCVSSAQRRRCPAAAALLDDIPNGVDLGRFSPTSNQRSYALLLARICPEKGIHLGLDAARAAGVPLLLGGSVFRFPAHQLYFERDVVPRLDRQRRFIGPVAMPAKAALLAGARCLLVPSQAAETSSLVSIEALASGTPVVAFRRGALPDLIEEGRTGFLVDSVDEMAAAVQRCAAIDPAACRRAAERFSSEVMCGRYLELYQRLARVPSCPVAGRSFSFPDARG